MLGALARAYAVLGDESYRAAAEKNLAFLRGQLVGREKQDACITAGGRANAIPSNCWPPTPICAPGRWTFTRPRWSRRTWISPSPWPEAMLAKFYDPANGGFYDSAAGTGELILRCKDDYDGAEPSGNSTAVLALLRLGAITGRKEFAEAAEKTLRLLAPRLQELPQAVPHSA